MEFEQITEVTIAFLAGLLIGSFLNVCVFRLPRDLSVVAPRSFCTNCEKTIAWYDNIPVVSYVLLRGRCRHCQERIQWRYPAVELATAAAFAVCVGVLGLTLPAAKYAIFSAILVALIATDFEEFILPDEFTLGGTLLGLVFATLVRVEPGIVSFLLPVSLSWRWTSLAEAASTAAFFAGMTWLLGWSYEKVRHREGMGLGDVKMIGMIGTFLGLSATMLTFLAASILGTVVGGAFMLAARKKPSEYEIPLGCFLGLSALAVGLYGQVIKH